jgi:hypothetical protein
MAQLVAPLARAALGAQDPVHCRDRAQVHALVEQPRPDLPRRGVHEALARERLDDGGALLGLEGSG